MGIFRTLFLGDVGNWLDARDNRDRVDRMRRQMRSSQRKVNARQDERIEKLELCLASLSQLLVSKNVVSESEIERIVDAIEADADDDK